MSSTSIFRLSIVLFLLPSLGFNDRPLPTDGPLLVISVTSSQPDEILTFEGAYMFQKGVNVFHTVNQETPFTAQSEGEYVAAMFHKSSGRAQLRVELHSMVRGHDNLIGSRQANVVVVGTLMSKKPFKYTMQAVE